MKFRSITVVAAAASFLSISCIAQAQDSAAVDSAAFKVLDDAFTFYESNPIQFQSLNAITQIMGERRNEMEIAQRVTSSPAGFTVIGTSEDFPAPLVHFSNGTATVVFEREKSYIQIEGVKDLKAAFESADLGYDASVGENSLLGATPGVSFFQKLFAAGAEGRKSLITSLKLGEEKVVSGTAGHLLSGQIKANPVGLPVENAVIPFEMVIGKGDTPVLLSYTPDNSALIEDFAKTRPQLGALQVSMDCTYTDWKTGASIDAESLKLPDLTEFKKYNTFGELVAAMQGGGAGGGATELEGKAAPDFELATSDGGKFKLSDEKGKNVVILDFWATWCGPCVKAMPVIDKVAKAFAAKGVKFVAVNLRETEADVKGFMEQHKLAPTVAMDKDGAIATQYMVSGIPQTVIVGKDGNVAKVHVGLLPDLEQQLTKELTALTAE